MATTDKAQCMDETDWERDLFECSVGICKSKSLGEADRKASEWLARIQNEKRLKGFRCALTLGLIVLPVAILLLVAIFGILGALGIIKIGE